MLYDLPLQKPLMKRQVIILITCISAEEALAAVTVKLIIAAAIIEILRLISLIF